MTGISASPDGERGVLRDLRQVLPGVLAWAGVTLAVELAVLWAAAGLAEGTAAVMTLAAAMLWVILAVPLACCGEKTFPAVIRAAAIIDATGVMLIVLAAQSPVVSAGMAVKAYLLLAALAAGPCAWVRLARGATAQKVVALAAGVMVLIILAGPFWSACPVLSERSPVGRGAFDLLMRANPLLATGAILPPRTLVWQEGREVLYEYTTLGRDRPAPDVGWPWTCAIYGGIALVGAGLAAMRRQTANVRPVTACR